MTNDNVEIMKNENALEKYILQIYIFQKIFFIYLDLKDCMDSYPLQMNQDQDRFLGRLGSKSVFKVHWTGLIIF